MFYSRRVGSLYFHRDNPTDPDFESGDFTKDGDWHPLDLSAIIPKNTKLIILRFVTACLTDNYFAKVRTNGEVGTTNYADRNILPSGPFSEFTLIVSPDANSVIEYMFTTATWPQLNMTIGGWFV